MIMRSEFSNSRGTINSFILFLILFTSLYSPKFGLIDFTIIGIFIGIIYLLVKKNNLKLYLSFINVLFLMFTLLAYTLIIYGININDTSIDFTILRMIRTTIFLLFFITLFSNIDINAKKFIDILLLLLGANAFFILLEVFFPATQEFLAYWSGYNKIFFPFRGFGLIGSFDGAGFLSTVGLILIYLVIYKYNKVSVYNIFYWLLFSSSVVLTGRTYMFLSLIVNIVALSIFLIKGKKRHKIFAIIVSLIFFTILFIYVLPLLILTLNAFGYDIQSIYEVSEGIDSSFNINNTSVYADLLVYPSGIVNIVFGNASLAQTDYGYLKQWHMLGIIGVLFILLFYSFIVIQIYNISNKTNNIEVSILSSFFILYTAVLLISNIKLLFIFGRTTSDIHWLLYVYIINMRFKND